LQQREESHERKTDALDQRERKLSARERSVEQHVKSWKRSNSKQLNELERIARLSEEQAQELLLSRIENQVRSEAGRRIRAIEEEAAKRPMPVREKSSRSPFSAAPPTRWQRRSFQLYRCRMTR